MRRRAPPRAAALAGRFGFDRAPRLAKTTQRETPMREASTRMKSPRTPLTTHLSYSRRLLVRHEASIVPTARSGGTSPAAKGGCGMPGENLAAAGVHVGCQPDGLRRGEAAHFSKRRAPPPIIPPACNLKRRTAFAAYCRALGRIGQRHTLRQAWHEMCSFRLSVLGRIGNWFRLTISCP